MTRSAALHDNLRISVTDRCNIRCYYCMPEDGVQFVDRREILDFEEIERFARIAVGLGVTNCGVTGGEPLLRQELPVLIEPPSIAGVRGSRAHHQRRPAGRAPARSTTPGCGASTSTSTRSTATLPKITRRDDFDRVMAGIDECARLGYRVKLNAVAVKDLIEPDIVPLARFARERGIEVRYIEFMPLDAQDLWDRGKVLLADDMIAMLSREISPLIPIPDPDPRAPATEYDFADGVGRVGFIASVSRPFCLNCNRLRLTADGKLRYCLFAIEEDDVKTLMRSGAADDEIAALIRKNVAGKWEGHEINSTKFVAPPRPMYSIGG